MTDRKEESLWKICDNAFSEAIAESDLGQWGVSLDRVYALVCDKTSSYEYNRDWMFKKVVQFYMCLAANTKGYASAQHGSGVYFNKCILNKAVSQSLVDEYTKRANEHDASASDMIKLHRKKFEPNSISGQGVMVPDGENLNIYEAMNTEEFIRFITESSSESEVAQ